MFFWRDISQKKLTNVEGLDFAQSSLLTSRSHLDAGIHELSHRSGGLRSKIQKPSTCLGNKTGKKNTCSHKKGYQLCKNCNYSVLGGVRQECLNLCTEMGRLFALWNRLIPCKSGSDILCFCVLCTILWTKELPKHCHSIFAHCVWKASLNCSKPPHWPCSSRSWLRNSRFASDWRAGWEQQSEGVAQSTLWPNKRSRRKYGILEYFV